MLFIMLFIIFFSFLFFIILFCSNFWSFYFTLELQWMLLLYFFMIGNSNVKGLLNYMMMNYLISLLLMIGIIFSNSMLIMIGSFGKIGFFLFFNNGNTFM